MDKMIIPVDIVNAVVLILQVGILLILVGRYRNQRNLPPGNQRVGSFTFNPEIISAFDNWLNKSISTYMLRFVDEKMGSELVTEDNLTIDSDFVIKGIEYVCNNVTRTMPNFYQSYMNVFYGEDKFLETIYEKVRSIFIEFVTRERAKRLQNNTRME